jgi:hypothetical protein
MWVKMRVRVRMKVVVRVRVRDWDRREDSYPESEKRAKAKKTE